jgi:hypothetical protein
MLQRMARCIKLNFVDARPAARAHCCGATLAIGAERTELAMMILSLQWANDARAQHVRA